MIDNKILVQFKEKINSVHNIVIIPHLNPDGDAMGSSLGLKNVLKGMNKEVQVVTPSGFPRFLSWMNGADDVLVYEEQKEAATKRISEAEVLIFVDFNSLKRVGEMSGLIADFSGEKIMIDHHPYPDDIVEIMISVPESSSTCELVYNLINKVGFDQYVNEFAAECFYTGIMTDTGSLSYNSSNPDTYRVVAKLLEKGINKDKIHELVFHSNSFYRMKLLGHVLGEKMFLLPDQNAAYLWLSKDELEKYNFQQGDTEGFVNYPLGIEGINISAFFMEKDDKVKCSFRSRGDFPVNQFSEMNFNGGGHRNAAGGESQLNMEDTIEKFKLEIAKFYQNYLESK